MSEADRLSFALKHLSRTDWEAFEHLASTYLAADFPELRTLAGVGDEGQDAVLYAVDQPQIVVQYSIAEDWREKVVATLKTLKENDHACAGLIYATNRAIGPRAESLKSELLREGVMLDIRDERYFVERIHRYPANLAAADRLSARVVDPLLPVSELARNSAVKDPDMRAGLVYLELWLQDPAASRNLVKVSYDSLVLSALRDTDSQNRRTRQEIEAIIRRLLPARNPAVIESSVDSALQRLRNRSRITVAGEGESFALHREERERRTARALEMLSRRELVRAQLADLTLASARELEVPYPDTGSDAFLDTLEQLFEQTLEHQGNVFAEAVRRQSGVELQPDLKASAEDVITRRSRELRSIRAARVPLVELATEVATRAFLVTGPLRNYLRELSDAYTMLAFMQEAPDVQRAVDRFFSRGRLILDTSVILPCLAESLLPVDEQRYTNLLRAAREAGMKLFTTEGVLNELNAHLDLSLLCHRLPRQDWQGNIPLVYERWFEITRGGDFAAFTERFRGTRGIEDIQLFMEQGLDVELVDLAAAAASTSDTARFAVTELWRPRKHMRPTGAEIERDIRLRHDIEMYFGALAWRRGETRDFYGYEAWWVTGDGTALRMFELARDAEIELTSNPCMAPNFLTNMLSIGPTRRHLSRDSHEQLPVALDIQREGYGIPGLSARADEVRATNAGEPEWLIRRRIRDRMNQLKQLRGDLEMPLTEVATVPGDESGGLVGPPHAGGE
jgi:hypothetical protein